MLSLKSNRTVSNSLEREIAIIDAYFLWRPIPKTAKYFLIRWTTNRRERKIKEKGQLEAHILIIHCSERMGQKSNEIRTFNELVN